VFQRRAYGLRNEQYLRVKVLVVSREWLELKVA